VYYIYGVLGCDTTQFGKQVGTFCSHLIVSYPQFIGMTH